MQADLLAGALRSICIFFPLFQVFPGFDIYSDSSGFNFGLLSSITDSAKTDEICLVIAVHLYIC